MTGPLTGQVPQAREESRVGTGPWVLLVCPNTPKGCYQADVQDLTERLAGLIWESTTVDLFGTDFMCLCLLLGFSRGHRIFYRGAGWHKSVGVPLVRSPSHGESTASPNWDRPHT